jgi:hypothetical protein
MMKLRQPRSRLPRSDAAGDHAYDERVQQGFLNRRSVKNTGTSTIVLDRSYPPQMSSKRRRRFQRCTSRTGNCIRSITAALLLLCCSIELASAQTTPYQSLLESVQSPEIGSGGFPSLQWRKSTAKALLSYCESVLSRVPVKSPSENQTIETEESYDVSAMPFEFARWQLATLFGDCIKLTEEILSARNLRQEIRVWVKLNRLLEDDPTILNLVVAARMLPQRHDGSYQDNVFGFSNWRTVRVYIFEAILILLEKPE